MLSHPVLTAVSTGWRAAAPKVLSGGMIVWKRGVQSSSPPPELGYPVPTASSERRRLTPSDVGKLSPAYMEVNPAAGVGTGDQRLNDGVMVLRFEI